MSKKIFLCTFCFFVFFLNTVCCAKMVSISKSFVNMRSGPGMDSTIIWRLPKGYPLKVIKSKNEWVKVQDFEGFTGWVHKSLVSNKSYSIVKKDGVNVRSGPGTKYRVVGVADYGTVFRVVKRDKGWVKIKLANGSTGWIYKKLLWGW